MMPSHHPSTERLVDYALGRLDPSFRLVLEAHLAFCEGCRIWVPEVAATLEDPLQGAPSQQVPSGLFASLLTRVRALPSPTAPRCGNEILPLPSSVWNLLPNLTSLNWQGAASRGFRFLRLPAPQSDSELLLLHLRKDCRFPEHGHLGTEQSMILCGGLQDEFGTLETGDYEESTAEKIHRPVALADEDCWLLSSVDGGVRFTGWRRFFQP
ncbi:MAG: cupin domain-containing protein [Holophaga sp.]|nr:cupin domain-containing protein [Holophaga sp.]